MESFSFVGASLGLGLFSALVTILMRIARPRKAVQPCVGDECVGAGATITLGLFAAACLSMVLFGALPHRISLLCGVPAPDSDL